MIDKNYTKIPNEIFTAPVSLGAFKLFCYLCSVPDEFKPSLNHMVTWLGISKTSLLRAQIELRNYKMICVEERKSFFIKRSTINPGNWDFSCAKNEHYGDGKGLSTRTRETLPRTRETLPRTRETLDQDHIGSELGSERPRYRVCVDQQVRLKSKTIKQDYKVNISAVPSEGSKKPRKNKFSDEDLDAAKIWQEYISENRPRIKVIIKNEAEAMAVLRKDFGWDNSFLEKAIKYLTETKTLDRSVFSYFWHVDHLKWFLSLTYNRSSRKADSFYGQVEQWYASKKLDDEISQIF